MALRLLTNQEVVLYYRNLFIYNNLTCYPRIIKKCRFVPFGALMVPKKIAGRWIFHFDWKKVKLSLAIILAL